MIEIDGFDPEDLACAGFRLVDDDWDDWRERRNDLTWLAPAPPKRRERRPSLES